MSHIFDFFILILLLKSNLKSPKLDNGIWRSVYTLKQCYFFVSWYKCQSIVWSETQILMVAPVSIAWASIATSHSLLCFVIYFQSLSLKLSWNHFPQLKCPFIFKIFECPYVRACDGDSDSSHCSRWGFIWGLALVWYQSDMETKAFKWKVKESRSCTLWWKKRIGILTHGFSLASYAHLLLSTLNGKAFSNVIQEEKHTHKCIAINITCTELWKWQTSMEVQTRCEWIRFGQCVKWILHFIKNWHFYIIRIWKKQRFKPGSYPTKTC